MTNPADELRLGDWNIRCDRCGKKMKGSEARRTWEGYYVCAADWEPRHPQDFVKGVRENPTPPFVRNPPDVFVPTANPLILEINDLPFDGDTEYIFLETGGFIFAEDLT
jgi:hypothetical protein